MDSFIREAREAISSPDTPDTVRFRELLAAIAPNSPLTEREFNIRCMNYASPIIVSESGEAAEQHIFDGRGRLAAVVIHFKNGNCAMWSTAGYLAYRTDPRF